MSFLFVFFKHMWACTFHNRLIKELRFLTGEPAEDTRGIKLRAPAGHPFVLVTPPSAVRGFGSSAVSTVNSWDLNI